MCIRACACIKMKLCVIGFEVTAVALGHMVMTVEKVIGKDPIFSKVTRCNSWKFFTRISIRLHPLHSAGCLPAKWQLVESKEVMYAVTSAVKTHTEFALAIFN